MSQLRMAKVVGIAAVAAIALGSLAATAAAEDRRIATLAPPGSTWMKILEKGAQEIEQATGGRIAVKYYPGGVQGDERDVVRKIRLKQLDGAAVTSIGLAMVDPSIRVLELPMLFGSVEEMEYVRDRMWPYFQKKFEKKGFVLGDPGEVGWVYFMSQTPIRSLADLRKTKTWMWSDDVVVREVFKKLNIPGVPLGVPEVLAGLTSGRINAAYGSPLAAVALQWNTKVKYMTSMPMSFSLGATITRKDVWDSATAEDQAVQKKLARLIGKKLRRNVRRDNDNAKKQMTRKGVEIIETPKEMVTEFEKSAQEVWADLTGKVFSAGELKMVLKFRDEYRKKNGKTAAN